MQAATGLGFALVLTPVLFALLSAEGAIVTATALGLVLNLLVLLGERRRPSVAWQEVAPILAAAAPGSVCGLLLLRAVPKPGLQVCVGVAVIVSALLLRRSRTAVPKPASRALRLALGFTTGAMTLSTGVNGPPLALWLARRGLSAAQVRDSLSASFLGTGLIASIALAPVLQQVHAEPALLMLATGCVVIGHTVGSRAFARLDTDRFERLLLAVILAAGAASIAIGASAL